LRYDKFMRYVIIGTSAAGLAAAETIRQWDRESGITLISDEPHLPYSRPLLTYLLSREIKLEQVFLKSRDYLDRWGFEARLGAPVLAVKPEAREVHLSGGEAISYDKLLVASGASPRLPGIPGEDLAGVHTLRHLADVQRLEEGLAQGASVAVVGAGAVGLKVADGLAHRGLKVQLLARGAQPLTQVLDPVAAQLLQDAVKRVGIKLHLHSWPEAVLGKNGKVEALALNNDRVLPVQAVLFSVGVQARTEFLENAGLADPGGIQVDQFMQTSYPDIYAAGDCTKPHHLITGQRAAFHIWPAAVAQGEVAGANMAGARRPYDGILPQNSISLKGFKIITGGHLRPDTSDGEIFSELDRSRGHYRRLVFQNGRLVGVTLVGPQAADAGIYFQIMARKVPVKDLPVDIRSADFHPGKLWA
jgi:nitrite reductase (NADH) large subunit